MLLDFCSGGMMKSFPIVKAGYGSPRGSLRVRASVLPASSQALYLQLAAQGVKDVGFLGKNDSYFVLRREMSDGGSVPVWCSQPVKNSLNPVWPPVRIPMATLCGSGDAASTRVIIQLMDHNEVCPPLRPTDWNNVPMCCAVLCCDGMQMIPDECIGQCALTVDQLIAQGAVVGAFLFVPPLLPSGVQSLPRLCCFPHFACR